MSIIQKSWPGSEIKKRAPMELYEKIMEQKKACNDLLQKRDDMIAILEDEIKDTDNQYKMLIEEYHENTSVLASRMEAQIQALEGGYFFKISFPGNRSRGFYFISIWTSILLQ